MSSCGSCGAENTPGARFCSTCGQPMAVVGDERRVVTVLFADVVGFTSLAEPLDPEKVKNLIDRWFERLVADITEFGGRVDKIVGDAIVALFGAPVAHEDDAERAVRAALRMQETLAGMASLDAVGVPSSGARSTEPAIRMRIGVNSGEVLVGALRAGGALTAMGDVVNTASRLQSSARPGEVVVGPATHAATRQIIRYEPRGLLEAKGREERVDAWAAVEPLLPPGYRPVRRESPLVGRDDEVALLRRAVDSSVANQRAMLALLVGDAGLGKTRLAGEVAQWAEAEHGALAVEGRCVPYGEANVWWPVAEALRDACLLEPATEHDDARRRTAERVGQAFDRAATDPEVVRVANGLMHLMGYEGTLRGIDPSNAREEAVRSVVAFVEASSTHQPVIIQLADLHWADDVVVDLVDTLLERLARRPFMLVATARQAIRDRWAPRPGRHNAVVVNLDPLGADAAEALLDAIVSPDASPELRTELLKRSGGNPFYLEELVALVGDAAPGVAGAAPEGLVQLPDTLRGLVAARLDSLGQDERAVVSDAAVLGRRSTLDALRRMAAEIHPGLDVEPVVAELVAKELFELDDGLWAFRSDVVREVAYATLTKYDRAKRHIGIATWMEAHHQGEWSDSAVDRIAHHYGVAAELAADLGETIAVPEGLRDRAVTWIGEAAERAARSEVLPVACRLFTQALDLVGTEPSRDRLRFLLGRSKARAESWDLDGARVDADEVLVEAEQLGDEACGARALLALGDVAQKVGDVELAVRTLDRAVAGFAALGDEQGRGEALRMQGMAELFRGEFAAAEKAVHAALEAFERVGSAGGEAWALQNLAWIAFTTGRLDEAEEWLQGSVSTFAELGDTVGMAWALGLLAFVKLQQGRQAEAEALGRGILDEARARGDRWATAMMLVLLSSIDLWAGRTDESLAMAEEASTIFAELGDPYGLTQGSAPYARGLVMTGRIQEGLAAFEEGITWSEGNPGQEAGTIARGAYAGACVQLGDPERAFASGWFDGVDAMSGPVLGDGDRLVTYGLALLQRGDAAAAVAALEVAAAPAADEPGRPFAVSALALALAGVGRVDEAMALTGPVSSHPAATYLDQATVEVAAALCGAREGDHASTRRRLEAARHRVDATGDRVAQMMVRIAEAVALDVLGDPDAEAARVGAGARLDGLGIAATGWWSAFALAAGAGAPA